MPEGPSGGQGAGPVTRTEGTGLLWHREGAVGRGRCGGTTMEFYHLLALCDLPRRAVSSGVATASRPLLSLVPTGFRPLLSGLPAPPCSYHRMQLCSVPGLLASGSRPGSVPTHHHFSGFSANTCCFLAFSKSPWPVGILWPQGLVTLLCLPDPNFSPGL